MSEAAPLGRIDLELAGTDLEAVTQTLYAFSMLQEGVDLALACGLVARQTERIASLIEKFVADDSKRERACRCEGVA